MTDHTPEPWKVSASGFNVEASHETRTVCQTQPSAFMKPDAARIVACVNACAGIPTEELGDMAAVLKALRDVYRLWQLEALKNEDGQTPDFAFVENALAPFREDKP